MPNGEYRGTAPVRHLAPGVTGEDLALMKQSPPPASKVSAKRGRVLSAKSRASNRRMKKAGTKTVTSQRPKGYQCTRCKKPGHNARTCGRPRLVDALRNQSVRTRLTARTMTGLRESKVLGSALIRVRAVERPGGIDLVVTFHSGQA